MFLKIHQKFHDKAVQSNILWLNKKKIGWISILQSADKQGNTSFHFHAQVSKRRYPCTQTASAVPKCFPCLLQFCNQHDCKGVNVDVWSFCLDALCRAWKSSQYISAQCPTGHFSSWWRQLVSSWILTSCQQHRVTSERDEVKKYSSHLTQTFAPSKTTLPFCFPHLNVAVESPLATSDV